MADHEIKLGPEEEVKDNGDNGNGNNNSNGDRSLEPDTAFLLEMNLLTVFLSLFSLSGEDCSTLNEEAAIGARNNHAKACKSRIHTRGKETSEVKSSGRPSQRFQAIKDFRHCRRM